MPAHQSTSSDSHKKTPPKGAGITKTPKNISSSTQFEGIKMLGILHFIGNIVSGGTL